jgi:hypothetical protein
LELAGQPVNGPTHLGAPHPLFPGHLSLVANFDWFHFFNFLCSTLQMRGTRFNGKAAHFVMVKPLGGEVGEKLAVDSAELYWHRRFYTISEKIKRHWQIS